MIVPSSVTNIGDSAFYDCYNLKNLTIQSTTPPTLGSRAFINNHNTLKIYVPSESVNNYKTASLWINYSSRIFAIS